MSESPIPRLLILSCSRRKNPAVELLPALERYDGPLFRIVRKYQRESRVDADALDVFVLSADLGLISGHTPIPDYDRRMTHARAAELRPKVLGEMIRVMHARPYREICIAMGQDYLLALEGYERIISDGIQVTTCDGGYGRQQTMLRNWLYGADLPRCPISQMQVKLHGVEINYRPEEVMEIARKGLATNGGDPTHYQAWYVQVDDQRVSVKWLVSLLTGLPVARFHTEQACRLLARLGMQVNKI